MVTYAVNPTWSGAGFQLRLSGKIAVRSFLVPPLTTPAPLLGVPVDLGAYRTGGLRDRSLGIAWEYSL